MQHPVSLCKVATSDIKKNVVLSQKVCRIYKQLNILFYDISQIRDPESYTSRSVATGRASLAGQVKG
jgi:hypothetical protein